MKQIKYELQSIIIGNGQDGSTSKLEKVHSFLRTNAQTGAEFENKERLKSEEESLLIAFAIDGDLIYSGDISEDTFISEGAEQKVYRFDNHSVIKLNGSIFYEYWFDYFNSILIHNYFFKSTSYRFFGFKIINGSLFAVMNQDFIVATETTNLDILRAFLTYNEFRHVRNNDYKNAT